MSVTESAAIDIEVYITLFKIRRNGFPDRDLRMHCFDFTPCRISDAFAVNVRRYEQQFKLTVIVFCFDNNTVDRFIVLYDPESCTLVDRTGNRLMGDDLAVLFKMIVPLTKLFQCTVIECFLIVPYKLLSVGRFKRNKLYFCHIHSPFLQSESISCHYADNSRNAYDRYWVQFLESKHCTNNEYCK